MRERIRTLLESRKEPLIAFLQDIVSIPSPCGSEGPVIERILREMNVLGYDEVRIDAMGNLIGRIGTGERILAFDGHCDTVAAGELAAWSDDPFSGACTDGRIYGRGSADQKGGLAAAVYAGALLKEMGLPEGMSVYVVASVMEEDFEGLCWTHLVETGGLHPDAIILTEPSNMQIKTGHRGRMEMNLTVRGVSSHGSRPDRGDNAIYRMMDVVHDIEALQASLAGPDPPGKGSIAVTHICSSSPSLCAVPDSAGIHLDRRLTGGESPESCLREIEHLPSLAGRSFDLEVPEYTVTSHTGSTLKQKAVYPMWLMEQDHPLVLTAERVFERMFASEAVPGVWQFATNGVTTKGVYDIPTIGFGPGDEGAAHAPNESIAVSELLDSAAFYTALCLEWSASGRR
ncbi:YgeY family selenium metabolism-linked hydrolase [bacterium]|nr:YgeY family selenium metabolism-linked hydrolase [bacterium]